MGLDVEVTDEMRATALKRTNDALYELDELRKARELPIEMLPLVADVYGSVLLDLTMIESRKVEAAEAAKHDAEVAKWQAEHGGGHMHNFTGEMVGEIGAAWHAAPAGEFLRPRRGHGAGQFGAGDEVLFKSARPVKPTPCDSDEYRAIRVISRPEAVAFRPEQLHITSPHPEHFNIVDVLIGNRTQFAQSGEIPGDMFAISAIDTFLSFETVQTAMDIEIRVRYVGPNPEGEVFEAKMIGTAAR